MKSINQDYSGEILEDNEKTKAPQAAGDSADRNKENRGTSPALLFGESQRSKSENSDNEEASGRYTLHSINRNEGSEAESGRPSEIDQSRRSTVPGSPPVLGKKYSALSGRSS